MFQVFQGFLKKLQSEQHVLDIWILSTKLALQDFMWAIELDLFPCGLLFNQLPNGSQIKKQVH